MGRRNAGKTSLLYLLIKKLIEQQNSLIVIIDSAVEHANKSLMMKISELQAAYPNKDIISVSSTKKIDDLVNTINYNTFNKILMFDVSKLLEYSNTLNDLRGRVYYREAYKNEVYEILSHLTNLGYDLSLFFDEIELNDKSSKLIRKLNSNGSYGVFSIHDSSYMHCLASDVEIVNLDFLQLRNHGFLYKTRKQPCGNVCLEIVMSVFYNKEYDVRQNVFWCGELALKLAQKGIDVELYCHNSDLYKDFCNDANVTRCDGLLALRKCVESGIYIKDVVLTSDELNNEIRDNRCVILCVDSRIFNNDSSLYGGHFICAYNYKGREYILNPKKSVIVEEDFNERILLEALNEYGSWRICCSWDC